MTTHNTEPIPVKDALRLCEMAIEDCDKATEAPWRCLEYGVIRGGPLQEYTNGKSDSQLACMTTPVHGDDPTKERDANTIFTVLSHAVMRPMLEFFKFGPWPRTEVHPTDSMYEFLAALRDHYDATRPDWRSK